MNEENLLLAFLLTLFAGLSTGIGSILAFFTKQTNIKFLSFALGFSAGVMIYVSLVEIFSKAKDTLICSYGESAGNWLTIAGFFGGIFLIGIIDKVIPTGENPHEIHKVEEVQKIASADKNRKLLRTGLFTALAIGIHNFPEGLATFIAALKDLSIGIPIAVAIAIHNIPEGIAVSIPIFYATGNKKKAFGYSFLSGLAEPIGALVGYFIIYQFMSDLVFGLVFSSVAGIMIYISLDELLPSAREFGEHHLSIFGMIIGMVVMAVSLVLFI
ncbi:MAG: zinc transporter ZupT [Ignavibacteriales bacterium]|nr:zinc transporter ZupT [Ignavibacteriales bacterium]